MAAIASAGIAAGGYVYLRRKQKRRAVHNPLDEVFADTTLADGLLGLTPN